MPLRFVPITEENRREVENLQLFPEQRSYIESVPECLAEAEQTREWRTVGIYDGPTVVGFAMYGCFAQPEPEGQLWLDRLLIDRAYQGRGYGAGAVAALLERLPKEYGKDRVFLSVYDDNHGAIRLYEKLGFAFNGELSIYRKLLNVFIALCYFLCRKRSTTSWTVRNNLEAFVQKLLVPDFFECPPLGFDIVVIVSYIWVLHISPETNC